MSRLIDLTGKRFGRLVILKRAENTALGQTRWLCICNCGNKIEAAGNDIRSGHTKSCGCLHREVASKRLTKHGAANTRLYGIWRGMWRRCNNPWDESTKRSYIDRGIAVCDEWRDYGVFRAWALANGYAENLTIDRTDNDKGYSPENCRWATAKQQANNRRTNVFVTYNGETKTVAEWAEITGVRWQTLHGRLTREGWDAEKAFATIGRTA
jgi:hypothetical protein